MKNDDAVNRPLDEIQWRAFRLFLSTLSDGAFYAARRQLDQEIKARAKSETNALRLFYSSLSHDDLQIARHHILFLSEPFPKPKRARATGTLRARARKPRS
jgi:hypothetical protein